MYKLSLYIEFSKHTYVEGHLMKARNEQHYIDSWNSHINQLDDLALQVYWDSADIDGYEKYELLKSQLKDLVLEAVKTGLTFDS